MKKYWSMSRFFKKRKHRYKFVASFFFFFNLDLLYFTVKRTWFPFLRCELDIGSIRGWNCFRPCLWSWVSQLCLAKWTAYIRGQRRVGCRVLLKGHGGKKEKKIKWLPPCLISFCRRTLTRSSHVWKHRVSGFRRRIKTIRLMESGQTVCGAWAELSDMMKTLVWWRVKCFHLLCFVTAGFGVDQGSLNRLRRS